MMASHREPHSRRNWSKQGKMKKHTPKYHGRHDNECSSSPLHRNHKEADIVKECESDLGFYFDKEKKKYFKILPGQNHPSGSSFITKESVQKKKFEETRQKDLKLLHCSAASKKPSNNVASISNLSKGLRLNNFKKNVLGATNIGDLVDHISLGLVSPFQFRNRIRQIATENLKPSAYCKVFNTPANSYERLEHMQNMISSTLNPNNMICLWSLKQILVQRIQTLTVKSVKQTQENTSEIDVSVTGAMIPKAVSKITSMCCAPVNIRGSTEEYVLYTTMCLIGNNPSLVMLRNLNCTDSSDFRFSEFNLSSKATWCSSWNCEKEWFSVGIEKCGLLVDVETRSMWELNSQSSDVLSQDFIQSGTMLYSGTRRGTIFGHDLRSKSTYHTMKLSHTAAVCSLKALCNENHLLASDFAEKITKWDLRQRKVVTDYRGHRNEHSLIPVHVNEDLNTVYSAGQDCYSRLWNLQTGELLKEIPPPHPASITNIPTLHYSDCIAGRPGLLMGMLDEVHFYST